MSKCFIPERCLVDAGCVAGLIYAISFWTPVWGQQPAISRAIRLTHEAESATKEDGIKQRLKSACGQQENILSLLKAKRNDKALDALDGARESLQSLVGEDAGEKSQVKDKVNQALERLHQAMHSIKPPIVPVAFVSGERPGDLVLGKTHLGEIQRRFAGLENGEGPKVRRISTVYLAGDHKLKLCYEYRPPKTQYQLYFDRSKTLVLVVDGGAYGYATRAQLHQSYPALNETRRAQGWYEEQARFDRCIALIVVYSTGTDAIDSIGYAFVCPVR